ncbi:MAG: CvpA family protein [Flavobacteriales bacterium]|nr:CvpA family protein [Flavobacteriales bacterium]
MSKIDIIIFFFLLISAWLGYHNGIVRMGMTLTGIVFSVLILRWKWDEMILYLQSHNLQNPYLLLLMMLVVIVLITAFFIWISGWIERFFKLVFLNWMNKLAGMFLAMIVGFLVLSFVIIIITIVPRDKPIITKKSLSNSVFAEAIFAIEKHTSMQRLIMKNFVQIKDDVLNQVEQIPMNSP